jgi:hypothetical protein
MLVAGTSNLPGQKNNRSDLPERDAKDQCSVTLSFPFVQKEATTPHKKSAHAETPHWYALPEWWLFILAVPTLGFLGWQAKETRRTADGSRDAAVAAQKSVDAFINSERAWLFTDKLFDFKLDMSVAIETGISPMVSLMSATYKNVGKTVCRTTRAVSRFHTVAKLEDLPDIPDYRNTGDTTERILPPGGTFQLIALLDEIVFSEMMMAQIRSRDRYLCFYTHIDYVDANGKERVFQECYIFNCPVGLILPRFVREEFLPGGPKAYRQYT